MGLGGGGGGGGGGVTKKTGLENQEKVFWYWKFRKKSSAQA